MVKFEEGKDLKEKGKKRSDLKISYLSEGGWGIIKKPFRRKRLFSLESPKCL